MRLVLYGASDCPKCKALMQDLKSFGVRFDFVDANAPETQDECDRYDVDKLPHVIQIDPAGIVTGKWIGSETQQLLESIRKK